jgi:saccharopine dehydrogenase-like NADP-dependent oxidoreductase
MKYQITIWRKGNSDERFEKTFSYDSYFEVITILNFISEFFKDLKIFEIDISIQEEDIK